ncbi:MAG: chlororespiratory reduction protein 7 [Leptolyngbyaceae bacterium]|nr:chlororespiratory reduction protein 7 [Leptolyngbyaceae bacterium]
MTDPRLYEPEAFVFLEAGKPEEILTLDELKARLVELVKAYPDDIPDDVAGIGTVDGRSQYLIDNYCELTVGSSQFFQWFAIRLEKN